MPSVVSLFASLLIHDLLCRGLAHLTILKSCRARFGSGLAPFAPTRAEFFLHLVPTSSAPKGDPSCQIRDTLRPTSATHFFHFQRRAPVPCAAAKLLTVSRAAGGQPCSRRPPTSAGRFPRPARFLRLSVLCDRASDAPSPLQSSAKSRRFAVFQKDQALLNVDPRERLHTSSGKDAFRPQIPPKRIGPFCDLSTASRPTTSITSASCRCLTRPRAPLGNIKPESDPACRLLQHNTTHGHNPRAPIPKGLLQPRAPDSPKRTTWRRSRREQHRT